MTISEFLRSSGITTKHYRTLRTLWWYIRVVPLLLAVLNNQTDDKRNRSFGIPLINQTLPDTIPIAIRFRVRWYTHRDCPIFRQPRFWFNGGIRCCSVVSLLRPMYALTHAICEINGCLATKLFYDHPKENVVLWFLY